MYSNFYTISSGMLAQQRALDTIGNNLVNAQTPGYRADRVTISAFEKELLTRQEAYNNGLLNNGVGSPAAVVSGEIPIFDMGLIKTTRREGDVAIQGEGFFTVRGNDGRTYLTRNGQFDIDGEGYLTLPSVGRVLGKNGAGLRVGTTGYTVEANGDITAADGRRVGSLQVLAPADYGQMVKNANGMFEAAGLQTQAAQGYELAQGCLELSNVNMSQELTYLIETQRSFQSCSSALQIVDQMNQKAVRQIASIT